MGICTTKNMVSSMTTMKKPNEVIDTQTTRPRLNTTRKMKTKKHEDGYRTPYEDGCGASNYSFVKKKKQMRI